MLHVPERALRDDLAQDGRHFALGPDLLLAYPCFRVVPKREHVAPAAHALVLLGVERLVPENVPIGRGVAVELVDDREARAHPGQFTLADARSPGPQPHGAGAGTAPGRRFRP